MSVKRRLEEAKRIPERFQKVSAIISLSDADYIMNLIEAVENWKERKTTPLTPAEQSLWHALKAVTE